MAHDYDEQQMVCVVCGTERSLFDELIPVMVFPPDFLHDFKAIEIADTYIISSHSANGLTGARRGEKQ